MNQDLNNITRRPKNMTWLFATLIGACITTAGSAAYAQQANPIKGVKIFNGPTATVKPNVFGNYNLWLMDKEIGDSVVYDEVNVRNQIDAALAKLRALRDASQSKQFTVPQTIFPIQPSTPKTDISHPLKK